MKSFASARLGFSLIASSALLTGCFSTADFLVDEDEWGDFGEGIGEDIGNGIACSISRSLLVPVRESGSVRLNGIGQAPTAIPTDAETVVTLSFASEPIDLTVTANGPAKVVAIGETSCGFGEEGEPDAIPYYVTVTLDAGEEVGPADLEIRLGGKLVETFSVDVLLPVSLSARLSDGAGKPIGSLVLGDTYYLEGSLRAENSAPIYGPVDFTVIGGGAELTPYFVGAYVSPTQSGELVIEGKGAGLSQRFPLEVTDARE